MTQNDSTPQIRIGRKDMGIWEYQMDRQRWIPWTEEHGRFAGPEMTGAQLREFGNWELLD